MATQCQTEFLTPDSRLAQDVARIEELVRGLDGQSGTLNALMREHFDSARFYLLSSMPGEYRLELRLAEHLLPHIEDDAIQTRVAGFLRSQDIH